MKWGPIAGNHDLVFDRAPEIVPALPWTYLEGSGSSVAGLELWGSPWTPWIYDSVSPTLCVYGHLHEGRGCWRRGTTRLANVAAVDPNYRLRADPVVVFDL